MIPENMTSTNQEPIIDSCNLKPGDILILSAKDDFVSKVIARITNSPVSHSSVVDYIQPDQTYPTQMLETTMPEARRNTIPVHTERTIYVRRLQDSSLPMNPIVDYMSQYVDSKEPYAFPNLIIIAIYLLTGDFLPIIKNSALLSKILMTALYGLEQIIDKKVYPGKNPMTCSQLVCSAYDHAAETDNPKYCLLFQKENLPSAHLLSQLQDYLTANPEVAKRMLSQNTPLTIEHSTADALEETICEELLTHFDETPDSNALYELREEGIMQTMLHFCVALLKASKISLENSTDYREIIQKTLAIRTSYVTPDDLYRHGINLEVVGVIPAGPKVL